MADRASYQLRRWEIQLSDVKDENGVGLKYQAEDGSEKDEKEVRVRRKQRIG